jgi:O-antigen/teichoic acid export membrane protein
MSTTRKIAHNTIAQILGKVISTGLGIVAIGMMAHYLGVEQFGWYATVIAFLQFVGILIDFGLIPVTAQMLSEPQFDKTRLLRNLLGFRLATAVVFLGVAPAVALFFPYPAPVKIAIAFSTISFIAIAMNQVLTGYYQTELRTHIQAASDVAGRVVLILGLWLAMRTDAGFLPVMLALVIATVAQTAVLWIIAARRMPLGFAYEPEVWRAIAVKMWPIAISIMFNVVYLKGDIILLSVFRSQSEVGWYGAAYRVLDILSQLGMMLMGVMLPLLAFAWSRGMKEEFRMRYQQAFDALMLFAVPMTVGALILGERVMILVGGEDFAEAGRMLQLLSIAVFGVYLGAVFGHAAVAINRQRETMWIYISDAIITLAGYLVFIPAYGMIGAAGMTIFSELYAGTLLFLTVRHYSGEGLRIRTFAKILLASAMMGAVLLALPPLPVILSIIAGGIIYGIAIVALRAISPKTLKEIFAKPAA